MNFGLNIWNNQYPMLHVVEMTLQSNFEMLKYKSNHLCNSILILQPNQIYFLHLSKEMKMAFVWNWVCTLLVKLNFELINIQLFFHFGAGSSERLNETHKKSVICLLGANISKLIWFIS